LRTAGRGRREWEGENGGGEEGEESKGGGEHSTATWCRLGEVSWKCAGDRKGSQAAWQQAKLGEAWQGRARHDVTTPHLQAPPEPVPGGCPAPLQAAAASTAAPSARSEAWLLPGRHLQQPRAKQKAATGEQVSATGRQAGRQDNQTDSKQAGTASKGSRHASGAESSSCSSSGPVTQATSSSPQGTWNMGWFQGHLSSAITKVHVHDDINTATAGPPTSHPSPFQMVRNTDLQKLRGCRRYLLAPQQACICVCLAEAEQQGGKAQSLHRVVLHPPQRACRAATMQQCNTSFSKSCRHVKSRNEKH
jgi:hypothetical protein